MIKNPTVPEKEIGIKPRLIFFTCSLLLCIVFGALFFSIKYVEKEGFNPSDDGVILAQSFRLIQGEIPHKDFISLTPVFSGVIHMIHFYSPFPLEISARWFTLLEFFIYSFLWVYILFKIFNLRVWNKRRYILLSMCAGSFAFFLNVNTYLLFPVTTIDAFFFSAIGFTFYINKFNETYLYKKILYIITGLFFASLAVLCNQVFAIPALIMILYSLKKGIKNKLFLITLLVILVGTSPILMYIIFMYKNDALGLCVQQLASKFILIQTGTIQYIKSFFTAKLFIINLATLLLFTYLYIKNKKWLFNNNKPIQLSESQLKFTSGIFLFYGLAAICFSFYYFISEQNNILNVPFELFWILIIISFIIYQTLRLSALHKTVIFAGILFSWTGSVSTISISPVFWPGIMAVSILVLVSFGLLHIFSIRLLAAPILKLILPSAIIISITLFCTIAIYGQQKINYKDKPSSELTACLCSISDEFGEIETNLTTYTYYTEFTDIFNRFPGMKNNFVMIPNNAIIYPIMNSRNPFPVDWLQPDQYSDSEKYLYKKIKHAIQTNRIYLVLDIYDSQKMAFKYSIVDYSKFKFLKEFQDFFIEIPIKSKFFKLYKSI